MMFPNNFTYICLWGLLPSRWCFVYSHKSEFSNMIIWNMIIWIIWSSSIALLMIALEQWYSTGGTQRHLRGYVDYTICITCIMYQQLWGYKVEEKLYLGVREQKRLNTTALERMKFGWVSSDNSNIKMLLICRFLARYTFSSGRSHLAMPL
jgi:hypothetical protein